MRRAALSGVSPEGEQASAAPSPSVEFASAAEQAAVQGALDRMAEPCQGILRALFVEEAPHEAVAKELGLSVGSIGVYRRRCLNCLRRDLEAGGWGREEGRSIE